MSGGSLDGPRLKLERARVHLEDLDRRVLSFSDMQAQHVVIHRNPETRKIAWVIAQAEEPPEDLGPVVGDCLHNLRSALDHLAWQLVLANGKKPGGKTEFPVWNTPEDFAAKSKDQVRGMDPGVVAVIEESQPYYVSRKSIGTTHQLNRIDKHRHFHLVVTSVESSMLMGWPDDPQLYYGPVGKGGAILLCGRIPDPEVPMEYKPHFDVAFADGPTAGWPVQFVLRGCMDAVLAVVRGLAKRAGLPGSVDHLIWPDGPLGV